MKTKNNELVIGGVYKHYKGTLVKVLGVAKHSETLEDMVYYIHLEDGFSWVRPKDMFLELAKPGIKRFKLIKQDLVVKPSNNN